MITGEHMSDIVERLRGAASDGFDEWRVQDPTDGSYCIAYSWPDTMSPERQARAWLADHKARFPDSPRAGYVVACVRVVPAKDRLLAEAADEIERLRKDAERYRWIRARIPGGTYRIMGVIYSEGGEGVDAAIDAAMSATPGAGEGGWT